MKISSRVPHYPALLALLGALCTLPSPAWAGSNLDQALCGSQGSASDEEQKLAKIQKDMPPVENQNPSDWCYAFAGNAVLNYFIHKENGTPYDPAHLISPLDLVAAQRLYEDKYHGGDLNWQEGHVDVSSGGQDLDVFLGAQEQPAMRSRAQVQFHHASSKDPVVKAEILAIHKKEVTEEEEGANPQDVSKEMKTLRIINPKLFEAVKEKGWTDEQGTKFDHYMEAAQATFGDPDLKLPPFRVQSFQTHQLDKFFAEIRKTLDKGHPMEVAVYSDAIFPRKNGKIGKSEHAMAIVGSGYEGGSCVVRLRNSWGTHSKSDRQGYVDVPAARFAQAVSVGTVEPGKGFKHSFLWVTRDNPKDYPQYLGKTQHLVGPDGDKSEFLGHFVKHIFFTKGKRIKYEYVAGERTDNKGKTKRYADGKAQSEKRMPASR